MRDEHYDPFRRLPHQGPPLEALVFVMARQRGDQTDTMRGSLRTGPHGWEAVYTLNGELYRSQWFASEAWRGPTWRRIRTRSRPPAGRRSRFSRDRHCVRRGPSYSFIISPQVDYR